ncbi:Stress responsive A/B Barrel Domain protein [Pirellulimonas nuda]|uniref:Stress responsive A/B Barrel Domain protein n=1 Tax=Pirellulimonas nuda TaxID=2528009 RepID=A0A518DH14_9BACT|nr:Dabb family protein [Pirellulimonas nuda]QDU90765.1 Stress responsive A/B Barrel Domain protein [Pirellulimonas nuda]
MADDNQLAHMVFFTLNDPAQAQGLVDGCMKYLTNHPGLAYFSAGARGEEFDRPVNDQEFHVALHAVFESKEAHDAYQTSPRHLEFVERFKGGWKQVRVFDSYV